MYAFIGVDPQVLPEFDDQQFALDLLEQKHVLVAPGVSFNVPYRNHFRITTLPDATTLGAVFGRIEELLSAYASGTVAPGRRKLGQAAGATAVAMGKMSATANVLEAQNRFK